LVLLLREYSREKPSVKQRRKGSHRESNAAKISRTPKSCHRWTRRCDVDDGQKYFGGRRLDADVWFSSPKSPRREICLAPDTERCIRATSGHPTPNDAALRHKTRPLRNPLKD